jgi:uncharacterized protein YgiM (DUF1202 family)
MSIVTVIGEPNGIYIKVSGKNTSGATITGYINVNYLKIIPDGVTVTYGTAEGDIMVYQDPSEDSRTLRALIEGSQYAVIEKVGDFSYVVGLMNSSSPNSIRGYAIVSSEPQEPETNPYYGITNDEINIRSGRGTSYSLVSKFALGEKIILHGDAVDNWYEVSGIDINGNEVHGYCRMDLITVLYVGVVNSGEDHLRMRDQASTAGSIITSFPSGTELVLIGLASNGWYKVQATVDGETVVGYCSADYIVRKGKLMVETEGSDDPENPENPDDPVTPPVDEKFELLDPNIIISEGVLTGVSKETTVSAFLKCFKGNVSVISPSGETLGETDLIGTGCILRVVEEGVKVDKATVLILGDVDGNGKINSLDYLAVKRYYLGTNNLSDFFLKAALITGKTNVSVIDFIFLKRMVMGTYGI